MLQKEGNYKEIIESFKNKDTSSYLIPLTNKDDDEMMRFDPIKTNNMQYHSI